MQVSETFAKAVTIALFACVIVACVAFVGIAVDHHSRQTVRGTAPLPASGTERSVDAQNAGNVGIYTRSVSVFTGQATSGSSFIFPDFGFAANFLDFCNTGFSGNIDVEYHPTNLATGVYVALATASFPAPDSKCHTLQIGGYRPTRSDT